ncbi:MAG TPA: hypothetical protein VIL55_02425 [Naasia sp.]|jgi:hypothetical protein
MSTHTSGGPGDDAIGEPFDQTGGLAGDLDGDSDGTAASDVGSAADRDGADGNGGILDHLADDDATRLRDDEGNERGGGDRV